MQFIVDSRACQNMGDFSISVFEKFSTKSVFTFLTRKKKR